MKRIVVILLSGVLLSSCEGFKPAKYETFDDVVPGPGLFSGKEGEFSVQSSDI